MQLGIDVFLQDQNWQKKCAGRRVAFLGHPASVTSQLKNSIDSLMSLLALNIQCAFGPQHGMRGEKQDNMIESDDYRDPEFNIPVFSLYGQVRRPTPEMMDSFDLLLVDLQDVGCRIYTFLTTLFYMLEACHQTGKTILVLDRPNPAGRPVEGHTLDMAYASFIGAAPLPMRHGLTLGEAGLWYKDKMKLDVDYHVVTMKGYDLSEGPGYGWPLGSLSWVNPSPNIPRLSTARQYAGTVLFEGCNISEGRGTTIPLEVFGFPGMRHSEVLKYMQDLAPEWLKGCWIRPCFFEPTFHKFQGQLVSALQVHVDGPFYQHELFRPYRLACVFLKAVHEVHPEFDLWRLPPYEYEENKMPIDILSGHSRLREWVENSTASVEEWEQDLSKDEKSWQEERQSYLLYPNS